MQTFASAMTIKTERRKKVRNRPLSLVYVELESANGGMMRDLSEEGFALRAMMPLQAGGKTQFAFSLNGEKRISGEGRIAWIKEDGRVAGIEFCGITQSAREEIREWLSKPDLPAMQEPRPAAFGDSEASTMEELREEARTMLARDAVQKVKAVEAATPPEPKIAPIPVPHASPPEERREEVHSSLPRMTIPTVEPAEAATEVVTEKMKVTLPAATLHEQQHEETRFTLPRISLVSVGSARSAELSEVPAENAAVRSLETQSEPRDISMETAPAGVPEAPAAESKPEPRPDLAKESEFSERVEDPPGKRFTLAKAIGIMVLLVLIAGAVAGHRQVGHALIWVGQAIAGDDGTLPPHSLVNEPLEPANQKPASALRDSLSAARTSSVGATGDNGQQEYDRAEEILRDRKREAEIGEAVQLLWLAAQKGNVNGIVTLAELYRRGRGVKKDCTQARILLSTAALKGSVEAREQLGKLAQEGCE
jgi:hypothetical protein